MEMRGKQSRFSGAGAPRRTQIKSTLAIWSVNDALIEKYLSQRRKSIAGKSARGRMDSDFRQRFWMDTKYGQFAQRY